MNLISCDAVDLHSFLVDAILDNEVYEILVLWDT